MTRRRNLMPRRDAVGAITLLLGGFIPADDTRSETAARMPVDPDLQTIKKRLVDGVLPTRPNDRQELAARVEQERSTLKADGSWTDIVYPKPDGPKSVPNRHLNRLLRMAKAYRTPSQPLFGSPTLLSQTLIALDFWLEKDYRDTNWWWNEIGVPQQLGETMLLIEERLSPEQKNKGIDILRHTPLKGHAAANAVWEAGNIVMRGLLENDRGLVAQSYDRMYAELKIVAPEQEGIQADYSFHQHDRQLYSGGYGYFYGNDLARYSAIAWGTVYQIPPERLTLLLGFLLDGQRWMVRGRTFDYSTIGREITRAGKVAVPTSWSVGPISPVGAAYGMPQAIKMLAACPTPRHAELASFAAYLNGDPSAEAPTGNRGFWMSDYMTHERPAYLATVRMLSDRMINSEGTNQEGKRSQHLGDGVTYLYRTGDEYRDIFAVWDWQRLPGTTCVQDSNNPFDQSQVFVKGKTSFVGSVSDGRYGASAFDFDRFSLKARKAWFFGDEGFVCLGAGITHMPDEAGDTGDPVLTSLNQCHLRGPIQTARLGGKRRTLTPGSHDLSGAAWVWHDTVGYFFAAPVDVQVAGRPQSGRWSDSGEGSDTLMTQDVFSLSIGHGRRPQNAAYAYVVLPGCGPEQIESRAANFEIRSNTPELQAVEARAENLVQAAFYQAGSLDTKQRGTILVDQPCLLQIRSAGQGDGLQLTVSNPHNKPLDVGVTVSGRFTGPGCTPAEGGTTLVRVALPDGPKAGSSVTVLLNLPKED